MNDVTHLLERAGGPDPSGADALYERVYEDLRQLAAGKLARERRGHTLQPTALVNEAYLRLVGNDTAVKWENRRHFFCAAAEAMRRILVDNARRKNIRKQSARDDVRAEAAAIASPIDHVLAVHEVLDELAVIDKEVVELVKLRFFAGLSLDESAAILHIPKRTAERRWSFARGWLFKRLGGKNPEISGG